MVRARQASEVRNKAHARRRGLRRKARPSLGSVLERLESRAMLAGDVSTSNVAPTLDALADLVIDEDAREQTVYLNGITDGSGNTQPLQVTASSSNTDLIPDPSVAYTSPKSFGVMTFTPVADAFGNVTVTVTVEDGGDDGDLSTTADNGTFQQTFDVLITAVNDTPVLDPNGSPSLGTVSEDAAPPVGGVGVLVSSLVDAGGPLDNFGDADGDTPGIAITATNLQGGTLWSSTDNGGSWTQVASVSDASPAFFTADANTRLFLQPAAGYTGAITDVITFHGWDQSTRWKQVGGDIDGVALFDNAGKAVALSADGLTLAVGASGNDGSAQDAGAVTVYSFDTNTSIWVPIRDAIGGESASDAAGTTVSLSADGTRLAIGAPLNDGAGRDAGQVRVFQLDATLGWVQLGGDIDGEALNDRSGSAISLSADGTTLAVGAFGSDAAGVDAGHARIFRWDAGSTSWVQLGADIDGLGEGDGAGAAVSLSADGGRVAVGSPRHSGGNGHVRIFDWNAVTTTWDQVGFGLDSEASGDNFGGAVSLSADGLAIAVGAIGNDGNGEGSGHVRVFRWDSGTSAWVQQGQDLDGEAMVDGSGAALALSADGSTVVIGATGNDGKGNNAGHARVYRWDASGAIWRRVNSDIDGKENAEATGSSVAVSADGSVVAVGAIGNSGNGIQAGQVRVFATESSVSVASDTASVEVLAVNKQPTIDAIADVSVDNTAGEQTVNLTGITAGVGDSQPLRVTAVSSDATIVPDPVVTYTSPSGIGSLAFTPEVGMTGTVTITVTVEDGGLDGDLSTTADNGTVEETFDITVTEAADPPVYESSMAFTSNGRWVLTKSDGSRFTDSAFAQWNPAAEWVDLLEADFDGDGLSDVAGRTKTGQWWAVLNQGDGTGVTQKMGAWSSSVTWVDVVAGDFNGDGRDDIAARTHTGAWWAALTGPVGSAAQNVFLGVWNAGRSWVDTLTGDFNNDGRIDIAGRNDLGEWWVVVTDANGVSGSYRAGSWTTRLDWSHVMPGDFNGDGRTDIVARANNGQWYAALGLDRPSVAFGSVLMGAWSTGVQWSDVRVGDFNGDGRSDILGRSAGGQWWAGLSQNDRLGFRNQAMGLWSILVAWADISVGDFNGDGRSDIVGRVAASPGNAGGRFWVGLAGDAGFTTSLWAKLDVPSGVTSKFFDVGVF